MILSQRFWLIISLILLCFLSLARYERFAGKRNFGDFHVYYVTGERMLAGKTIYEDNLEEITPFKYSPLVASFFAGLALLPEPWAAGIWHLLNLFFLFGSLYFCLLQLEAAGIEIPRRQWIWLGLLGILGLSPPILNCLNSGQAGFAILFFFVYGAYLSLDGKRVFAAGACLALSAMFKFLPLLIVPYLFFRRRFKLLFYFLLWFAIWHLLPILWLGWTRFGKELSGFLPFLTSTTLDHVSLLDYKNQSVWSYWYRLLYMDLGILHIRAHPEWLIGCGLTSLCVLYAFILGSARNQNAREHVIDFALLSILILIFNPNAWKHNFVLLIYPYVVLLAFARQAGWKNWLTGLLILTTVLFFGSNRSGLGWYLRYDLMMFSVLFIGAYALFVGLVIEKVKRDHNPSASFPTP
ncbi:MAG: hypothetical protein COV74_05560 [Candidatus Omnitrophica bacterium CG11_big_fil_rev_8_21_14_0_20_45_26]|uniref:DUF2029 domain-containing protein n=1 Tax=Candidatus Abzuiibacterium crystallinum TaxID=1974748 RepID=A0A2H0LPD8_9BACT|nr:MAG: hypothetical protein COV74_05560 [Candidatus Omnitrophica bacterium CG11_big_fil_rev_8_21_14_0_20_45_26]PIW63193.1 MAG: hypothetical protein COW12_11390 [Candidatus Omnitrophica bacterium CG12_big_fil_rev_8_21_14_0_65_45_16]